MSNYCHLIASIIYFTFLTNVYSQTNYSDSIQNARKIYMEKLLLANDPTLNDDEKKAIVSLSHFPVDENFRIHARFKKKIGKPFDLPTSSGMTKTYRKYGEIYFNLDGKKQTLFLYQDLKLMTIEQYKNHLFIPFRDETSAKETYGGGRYIDLLIPTAKQTTIDFNSAYNPYCAMSYRYNCPIPPEENTLKISIPAGEKTPIYKD